MVKEQNLMRILFRVTYIRQGVILKILNWLITGIDEFEKFVNQSQNN